MSLSKDFLNYSKSRLNNIPAKSMEAVLAMHAEGATVPFMARYRKERHGNLDEVQIRDTLEAYENWQELEKRKAFVIEEIAKQDSLTDGLKKQILASEEIAEVEELYRPYKKKKKTKAKMAADAGMTPLADWILSVGQGKESASVSLEVKAKDFINVEAKFATYDECLRGAQHILVERLSNDPDLRKIVKDDFFKDGVLEVEKSKDYKTNSKYSMYAEFKESVASLQTKKASHRYLAIRRGWQEGELKVSMSADNARLLAEFEKSLEIKSGTIAEVFLKNCAKVALDVHVIPSVVNQLHTQMKEVADQFAIDVFADNVNRVLMSSPFGSKVVLGVDPGLKTGCKLALIDNTGKFLTDTVLDILGNDALEKAKKLFGETLKQMQIEAIAVGNGTGGREAEAFLRKVLKEVGRDDIPLIMVNESGASVYSASEVAREEFPELDLTVRGAISIARRLQDPLAELVKIEPKSIGVGQYQHDVNQGLLKKSLHNVVESCVNKVGVDVNTASSSLLQYVAGIGPAIAKNIIEYRSENGLFEDRQQLAKVKSFSTKAYEQAAGFLRIPNGRVPLDRTGIHPERYQAVKDMLKEAEIPLSQALGTGSEKLKPLRDKWAKLIGEFTFDDVVYELAKPGRDPRDPFKVFKYREDIHEVKDLKPDMLCPGIVTNVTNFGAFVDIGVHQDGLVHISQLTHKFVDDPQQIVSPGDQVQVKVLSVDMEKNQIALTMLLEEKPQQKQSFKSDRKPQGGKKFSKGAKGKGPKGKGKSKPFNKGGQRPPRKQQNPFNNPFAALSDLNKK